MNRDEKIKDLGRMLPPRTILRKVIEKLSSGKFPELVYVGKKYTILDLTRDLEAVERGL